MARPSQYSCKHAQLDAKASVALVTGATRGIGKEIARQLGAAGWSVLVGARDSVRGAKAVAEVGGQLLLLDVTDPLSVAAAAGSVPKLDVLINNAGIAPDTGTVVQVFARPFRPQTNGKVERFNRTLLEEWAYVRPYGSNEMARRDVELGLGLCASAVTRASPWWSTALSTPRVADQRGVPASLA